jgi:hypothetical protein
MICNFECPVLALTYRRRGTIYEQDGRTDIQKDRHVATVTRFSLRV